AIIGTDIQGAFDSVDHSTLLNRLGATLTLEPAITRFVALWLVRRFRVRLGPGVSTCYRLHRGIPQGGILSPFLWNLMVRGFSAQLNQLPGTYLRFYSDDGTLHVLGATRAEVATRARHALTRLAQLLETRKLKLERSKCESEVDADWGADGLLDLGGATTVRSLRVLGVLIDPGFAFTDHLEYVVSKCQRRVQVLRRLASSSWGLSTAFLAHTACALLHHVACFGIVAIGPYVDQRAARRYDVRIGHVAARLVLGVSRTVRREALYTLSGL
ncbi:unnamed protein product, partial [Amoebophrya sp. A25]